MALQEIDGVMVEMPLIYAEPSENPNELHTYHKAAYFVIGLEGSGTNMLAEALREAGCYWTQIFADIRFDLNFHDLPAPLVFRRSIPHAGEYPYWNEIINQLKFADYDVHILWIIREPNATAKSVRRREIELDPASEEPLEPCVPVHAYRHIAKLLDKLGTLGVDNLIGFCQFTPITYEAFVTSEGFRRWLFEERLGLPYPEDFEVTDQNRKYYNECEHHFSEEYTTIDSSMRYDSLSYFVCSKCGKKIHITDVAELLNKLT